jgi:hypothetical protein
MYGTGARAIESLSKEYNRSTTISCATNDRRRGALIPEKDLAAWHAAIEEYERRKRER